MGAKAYFTRYFTAIYTNIICMLKYERLLWVCVFGSVYYGPCD